MSDTWTKRLASALFVALALLIPATTMAQGGSATPIPKVTGPVAVTPQSRPFLGADHDLPPLDLSKRGYVEEEFFVSGTANVYDWGADGAVTVRTPNAPYTTRVLIRRPSTPARFSGAVIVEPLFPARRWDWSMMWGYSHDHFIDHGDAWVGVTLPQSVAGLQQFSPMRYASLSFKTPTPDAQCATGRGAPAVSVIEDGLKWDMLSQVAAWLKSGRAPVRAQAVYLTTQGGDLTTYASAIHPRATLDNGKPVYDGYLAKAPFAAARINQCPTGTPPATDPRQTFRNIGVPVIAVAAQGEVMTTYPFRRADNDEPTDKYRLYEVAGAGHIDRSAYFGFPSMEDQAAAGNAQGSADWPFAVKCEPDIPLMTTPLMTTAFDAAFANLDLWVRKGIPAPKAPRLQVINAGPEVGLLGIALDENGNGIGGVRSPYVDVPAATYATNSPGPGNCREMGRAAPYDASRIATLYGNEKSYATKLAESANRLVKERWLTEADARRITAQSNAGRSR